MRRNEGRRAGVLAQPMFRRNHRSTTKGKKANRGRISHSMKTKNETRGRKTVLDTVLTKRICKLLAQGSPIKSACTMCGIGERTYHDWNERGQQGEQPYARFFAAATRARERHKANLIERIIAAAKDDWKAASWLLERQFPGEFGNAAINARNVPANDERPLTASEAASLAGFFNDLARQGDTPLNESGTKQMKSNSAATRAREGKSRLKL